jgi:PII-like signaling protein
MDGPTATTDAFRLSVYFGNADRHRRRLVATEILHRAHHAGLAGVTTMQGVAGYGHSSKVHTTPTWRLVDRTPVTVHIIDAPDRIQRFVEQLDDLSADCLVVCDRVRIWRGPAIEAGD